MKKVLLLGGTLQIGRLFLEKYQKDTNLDITIFNRGITNAHLFPEIKKIQGDRNTNDIEKIFNKNWDVVLDFSCYNPYSLKRILDKMQSKIGKYIFISTISVYDFEKNKRKEKLIDENFDRVSYTEEQLKAEGLKFYAQKKCFAEDLLISNKNLDYTILRPHFIYGKYDWQNLDYYWHYRAFHSKKVLLPNQGVDLVSWSFVEDLVDIIYKSIFSNTKQAIYNTTTHRPISQKQFLKTIENVSNKKYEFVSASTGWLKENKIRPIFDIPLWSGGNHFQFDNTRVINELKMVFVPFEKTIRQTYLDYKTNTSFVEESKIGLKIERETEFLKKLHLR